MEKFYSIELNGCTQWIQVKGNVDKPILLFLHGGPGTPSMNMVRKWNIPLLDHFLIVTWDQRGTGTSYNKKIDTSTLSVNQLVLDTHTLTKYLQKEFMKDKIYLMGHSFGATLGLQVIAKYPEDYISYFGVSQFINTSMNESSSYEWLVQQAKRNNDAKALSILNKIGKPVDGFYDSGLKGTTKAKQLVSKYRGDMHQEPGTLSIIAGLLFSKEYGGIRFFKSIKGIQTSLSYIGNDLKGIDYQSTISEVKIPIYFFSGDYDQLTPQLILREYFSLLKAPIKKLYTFSGSAHSPLWEESEKFHKIIDSIMNSTEI